MDVPVILRKRGLIVCAVWLSEFMVVCPNVVLARRFFRKGQYLFEVLFSTSESFWRPMPHLH